MIKPNAIDLAPVYSRIDLLDACDDARAETRDAVQAELDAKDRDLEAQVAPWEQAWNEHACVLEALDPLLARFAPLVERIRDSRLYPSIDRESAIEALIDAVEDLPNAMAWDFGYLHPGSP